MLIQGMDTGNESNYQMPLYPCVYFFGVIMLTMLNFKNLQIWLVKNVLMKQQGSEQSQISEIDINQEQIFDVERFRRG